jgi:hypothetical protein
MTAARTHVLIAENYNNGLLLPANSSIPLIQPPNRVDWASMYDELTWTLTCRGITDDGTIGAPANTLPTAFALTARFEYRQAHAGVNYRFQTSAWSNMSDDEVMAHIVEGRAWRGPGQPDPIPDPITGIGDGIICNQLTTGYNATTGLFANKIVVRRTLRHFPQGVRINMLNSTFTGGTHPRFLAGIEVTGKEK